MLRDSRAAWLLSRWGMRPARSRRFIAPRVRDRRGGLRVLLEIAVGPGGRILKRGEEGLATRRLRVQVAIGVAAGAVVGPIVLKTQRASNASLRESPNAACGALQHAISRIIGSKRAVEAPRERGALHSFSRKLGESPSEERYRTTVMRWVRTSPPATRRRTYSPLLRPETSSCCSWRPAVPEVRT